MWRTGMAVVEEAMAVVVETVVEVAVTASGADVEEGAVVGKVEGVAMGRHHKTPHVCLEEVDSNILHQHNIPGNQRPF